MIYGKASAWQFWKLIRQECCSVLTPILQSISYPHRSYWCISWAPILSGIILDAMCNIMYQYVQCNLSLCSKREMQQQLQVQMSITQQGDMIWFKTIVVLHLVNRLYKLLQIYISNSSCTGSTFVAQKISTDWPVQTHSWRKSPRCYDLCRGIL